MVLGENDLQLCQGGQNRMQDGSNGSLCVDRFGRLPKESSLCINIQRKGTLCSDVR